MSYSAWPLPLLPPVMMSLLLLLSTGRVLSWRNLGVSVANKHTLSKRTAELKGKQDNRSSFQALQLSGCPRLWARYAKCLVIKSTDLLPKWWQLDQVIARWAWSSIQWGLMFPMFHESWHWSWWNTVVIVKSENAWLVGVLVYGQSWHELMSSPYPISTAVVLKAWVEIWMGSSRRIAQSTFSSHK